MTFFRASRVHQSRRANEENAQRGFKFCNFRFANLHFAR